MVTPPFALCTSDQDTYGPIQGSAPDWAHTNFLDRGRHHTAAAHDAGGLKSLQQWYSGGNNQQERRIARHVEAPASGCYAEPVVQGAHSSYYGRRALDDCNPEGYRSTRRVFPPQVYVDRPTGKKFIPEPKGAPPRLPPQHTYQPPCTTSVPEPGMPRLSRPQGATILRESDQELSYERAFGRKVRVGLDTYRGSGRAGDLSLSMAPPRRPEDHPLFFKAAKDSPTFTRFVSSLPAKPAVGPHQRRAEELQRVHLAELHSERQLVASLGASNSEEDS